MSRSGMAKVNVDTRAWPRYSWVDFVDLSWQAWAASCLFGNLNGHSSLPLSNVFASPVPVPGVRDCPDPSWSSSSLERNHHPFVQRIE
jgi:hypothetical protein